MITRFQSAEDRKTLFELRTKLRLAEAEVDELSHQLEDAQARVSFYQGVIAVITHQELKKERDDQ